MYVVDSVKFLCMGFVVGLFAVRGFIFIEIPERTRLFQAVTPLSLLHGLMPE